MKDADRLSPEILAQVDLPAYWSAVLNIDAVLELVQGRETGSLLHEWETVRQGARLSLHEFQLLVPGA